jgi:serine/threonine-protein kinase RsbW
MMVHATSNGRDMGSFRLSVPGTVDQRPLVIQFIISVCRAYAVPLDVEHSVVSAFGEAFNNICMHSYRDVDGDVVVEVELKGERLQVRLRDRGVGFDPSAARAPDLDKLPEGGLGLFIILRAMDEVRWYREDEENVVAMAKKLPRHVL